MTFTRQIKKGGLANTMTATHEKTPPIAIVTVAETPELPPDKEKIILV